MKLHWTVWGVIGLVVLFVAFFCGERAGENVGLRRAKTAPSWNVDIADTDMDDDIYPNASIEDVVITTNMNNTFREGEPKVMRMQCTIYVHEIDPIHPGSLMAMIEYAAQKWYEYHRDIPNFADVMASQGQGSAVDVRRFLDETGRR